MRNSSNSSGGLQSEAMSPMTPVVFTMVTLGSFGAIVRSYFNMLYLEISPGVIGCVSWKTSQCKQRGFVGQCRTGCFAPPDRAGRSGNEIIRHFADASVSVFGAVQ